MSIPDDIVERLQRPFPASEVCWKPTVIANGKALACAFVNARTILDRLDEVFGINGWRDEYDFLPDGSVVCRLFVRCAGEQWVVKSDVGSPSKQANPGDRRKAAASDSLKRAAIKLGIARYLYRLPPQWLAYDVQTKRFTQRPAIPTAFLPKE